jgi:hypothetical protein
LVEMGILQTFCLCWPVEHGPLSPTRGKIATCHHDKQVIVSFSRHQLPNLSLGIRSQRSFCAHGSMVNTPGNPQTSQDLWEWFSMTLMATHISAVGLNP